MHLALETNPTRFVIVGGSNNSGGLGANRGSGADPPTLRRFLQFLPKKYAF